MTMNCAFLSSNIHEDVSIGTEYESEKCTVHCHKNVILGILLNKSKSFEWHLLFLFFVLNDK